MTREIIIIIIGSQQRKWGGRLKTTKPTITATKSQIWIICLHREIATAQHILLLLQAMWLDAWSTHKHTNTRDAGFFFSLTTNRVPNVCDAQRKLFQIPMPHLRCEPLHWIESSGHVLACLRWRHFVLSSAHLLLLQPLLWSSTAAKVAERTQKSSDGILISPYQVAVSVLSSFFCLFRIHATELIFTQPHSLHMLPYIIINMPVEPCKNSCAFGMTSLMWFFFFFFFHFFFVIQNNIVHPYEYIYLCHLYMYI